MCVYACAGRFSDGATVLVLRVFYTRTWMERVTRKDEGRACKERGGRADGGGARAKHRTTTTTRGLLRTTGLPWRVRNFATRRGVP